MPGLGSYGASSDEETAVSEAPLSTAEVRAAKRARQPAVNAFNMMRTSHRASSSTDNDPTNTIEGAGTVELDGEMPVLAATERGRSVKKKSPTKSGRHRLKEIPGQGLAKVMGNLRCAGCFWGRLGKWDVHASSLGEAPGLLILAALGARPWTQLDLRSGSWH